MDDFEKRVQHILSIDVPNWQIQRADNFTCLLLALLAQSDPTNQRKLGNEYPETLEAFRRWQRGDSAT